MRCDWRHRCQPPSSVTGMYPTYWQGSMKGCIIVLSFPPPGSPCLPAPGLYMNRDIFNLLIPVGLLLALRAPCHAEESRPTAEQVRFFETRIRPLLAERCFSCHGPEKQRSDLRMDSAEALHRGGSSGRPVLVAGQPDKSLLIRAVRHHVGVAKMPPKEKLPDRQVADLVRWIEMGAAYPPAAARSAGGKHWAFQPAAEQPLPAVKDAAWPRTAIDRFILAKLEARGLRPARRADRHTLIRRVTFDL